MSPSDPLRFTCPWLEDLTDEDDEPIRPAEALTLAGACGWWSASLELADED